LNGAPILPHSVATHDGPFHADEVTACALLCLYNQIDRDRIVRSRKAGRIAQCEFVCDVGGVYDPTRKAFDHHQIDYQGPLSSAGMVWLYFRDRQLIDDDEYRYFNEALIVGVDAHDNGKSEAPKGTCTFSHIISNFSPIEYEAEAEDYDRGFQRALDFTIDLLKRLRQRYRAAIAARAEVERAMKTADDCLIFDRRLPWLESFFALGGAHHSASFVIMPTTDGWKLRGIPPTEENKMAVRILLPAEWAGLAGEELRRVTGINGAIFCHKGRFISIWKTKEDALAALKQVMRNNHDNHL
jgi:uncharacterized UPF0160 family protein